MQRIHHGTPREGWKTQVVNEGLVYLDSLDENDKVVTYWREGPHYTVTSAEQQLLENASSVMFQMCIDAGDAMIENPELMLRMGIPEWAVPEIKRTWETDAFSVYGRFDWRFGGDCEMAAQDPSLRVPKLLEFNADTPTSLFEGSVTQWNWFQQAEHAGRDQWNNLYDSLTAAWKRQVEIHERATSRKVETIHLVHSAEETSGEDYINTTYMAATAQEAGYKVKVFYSEHLRTSVSNDDGSFYYIDPDDEYIEILFKLYPWEWLTFLQELNGCNTSPLLPNGTTWVEPPYKMLWSNKALLPVLWELFKDDPKKSQFLLPAYFHGKEHDMANFVRKPLLGREGANVSIYQNNEPMMAAAGPYGEEGFVDQAFAPLPNFHNPYSGEDNHPVLGVWMIDGEPQGLGIRESSGLITDNMSFFAPHVLVS